MIIEGTITDASNGELLAKVQYTYFIRGIGGFGHVGKIRNTYPDPPKRKPDYTVEDKSDPN